MKNFPIISKAWQINNDKFKNSFLMNYSICHAKTEKEARKYLFEEIKYDGYELLNEKPLSYLTIPVKRSSSNDIIQYEDKNISRHSAEYHESEKNRKNDLLILISNPNFSHYYIKKYGLYYHHSNAGYVTQREDAGIYSATEAYKHAISCSTLIICPINIEEHNEMLMTKIKSLESRIIK
jgi:hypothetical protein